MPSPDPFWPGDHRAGAVFTARALIDAMITVERCWLESLADAGIAEAAQPELITPEVITDADLERIFTESEAAGNPVPALLRHLRDRLPEATAEWLHRGLTSQDVVDSAMMIMVGDVLAELDLQLGRQTEVLCRLADEHRDDVMPGRTLGQPAVPITFGLKAANWLTGVLDAADAIAGLGRPAQFGGAAGTMAAGTELARQARLREPATVARRLAESAARRSGLRPAPPWHTSRAPVTRIGDALADCCTAWGRIANDVITGSRPEIGELAEAAGGGSSTMPGKANPILSIMIRRAALAAPSSVERLRLAAAEATEERSPGGWHLEWTALAELSRHTLTASGQTSELVAGLRIDATRMRRNCSDDLLAEASSMITIRQSAEPPSRPDDYLGTCSLIIDAVLARASDGNKG
ncbi:lyase family protein [Microlunatus elymi]|uniref:lyase family protein n=1 Tax=Microlunatus elymi TaxID=2596828 RepID=UPI001AEFD69E|nr:lyase family protein [Microlunatus elymi]